MNQSDMLFAAVRNLAVANKISKIKVQKQDLYIFVLFSNTSSSIKFDLATAAHGVALNKSDVFVANGLVGLGFQAVYSENGKEAPANTHVLFNSDDLTNPGLLNTARAMNVLYTGKMELKSDTDVRIQDQRTDGFRGQPKTSVRHTNQHFVPFSPMLFVGGRTNEATVNFGTGDFAGIAGEAHGANAEWKMYGCMILPGIRVIGGANHADLVTELDKITK
jgi:hypothetical protein